MTRKNIYGKCIYTFPSGLCDGSSPLHPKEHAFPAGLGNFRNDVFLESFICYACQARFSKAEAVFLQNGTEAFFRRILGVKGRKKHRDKNIFLEPTLGLSPLSVRALHPTLGYEVLWEMNSQGEAIALDQLVFKKTDGTYEHVPIRSGTLNDDLTKHSKEWRSWQLVACLAKEANEEELQGVLSHMLEGMIDKATENGSAVEIEGEMRAQISLPYVQAIAKIALHFALSRFHFTGFEEEFNDIKRFIYLGEGEQPARIAKEPLLPQLTPDEARLRVWSHFLTAELDASRFFARIQFFAGPRLKPFTWHVNLGCNPSRLIAEMALGFHYFYYEHPDRSGYTGGIEQLRLGPKVSAQL